jgi:hypothetical protein
VSAAAARPALALLGAAVLLAGCGPRPAPRAAPLAVGPLPSAEQLVGRLAQRRTALTSLRAVAHLRYASPEESHKAKQLVVVARPDRLRLEILSPFGAVFVLAAADGQLAAWARDEATVYRGAASEANLGRYALVDVSVATAVDLLLATPPMRALPGSVVSANDGDIELWEDSGRAVRVAWFAPDTLEPVRYEHRDPDGGVRLRAGFAAYAAIGGVRVAQDVTIELPREQRRIDIALSDVEVNPALPAAVFALATPPGSRVVDLDAGAP